MENEYDFEAIIRQKCLQEFYLTKVMHPVIRNAYLGNDIGDIASLDDQSTVQKIRNAE